MLAKKVDANQPAIVKALRDIPGVTVEVGHDDILVGYKGRTFWFEVKSPESISPRTGQVRLSAVTASERERAATWRGHYQFVSSADEIMEAIGI